MLKSDAGRDGFDWLLRWFDWWRQPDRRTRVLDSRPTIAPGTTLDVHYVLEESTFKGRTFRLTNSEWYFNTQLETDGWVVALLDAFAAHQSVAEVYAAAKQTGRVPEGFDEADFVDLVGFLVERGLIAGVPAGA